jgi:molybdenum cofactor sulfurtransferase
MARLGEMPEISMDALEKLVGHRLGVVRVSLGLASNFEDVWRVVEFVRDLTDEHAQAQMWAAWKTSLSFPVSE